MANTVKAESGWKPYEKDMLLREIQKAEAEGRPVKSVFLKVAEQTGRKPNSIRNYYYMKLKENEFVVNRIHSFIPFSEEEITQLMEHILTEQAKGKSVRSIATEMAHGDKRMMLRYQNKFRSIVKSNPEIVESVMQKLAESGLDFVNPYEKKRTRSRGKSDMVSILSEMVQNLEAADQDAEAVILCLNNLARAAQKSEKTEHDRSAVEDRVEKEHLSFQNALLKKQYDALKELLKKQSELTIKTTSQLNELVALNKNFIELKGMYKISGLSEYVLEIERFISNM